MITGETGETPRENWNPPGTCCRVFYSQSTRRNNCIQRQCNSRAFQRKRIGRQKIYRNKKALVFGRVDKVDDENVIIEGDSEFRRLFCRYSSQDVNKVLALREDSRVKVRGTLEISWAPWGMYLNMYDCRVI